MSNIDHHGEGFIELQANFLVLVHCFSWRGLSFQICSIFVALLPLISIHSYLENE